jgi:hypothetical protein
MKIRKNKTEATRNWFDKKWLIKFEVVSWENVNRENKPEIDLIKAV